MKMRSLEIAMSNNQKNIQKHDSPPLPQSQSNLSVDEIPPPGFSLSSNGSSSPDHRLANSVVSDNTRNNFSYSNMSVWGRPLKRRGRPRKYGPDSSLAHAQMCAAAMPSSQPQPTAKPRRSSSPSSTVDSPPSLPVPSTAAPVPIISPESPTPPSTDQRPHSNPSSDNFALGLDHSTPTTIDNIIVKLGEDVFSKILTFIKNSPEAISIISGVGFLSTVTLYDPADEIVTYEGRFNIDHMVGLFVPLEEGGIDVRKMKGSLQIALIGSNGKKIYGRATSGLTAASTVQVMIRSFGATGGAACGVD